MCFYKDTQALLAKNTLRQFFINKAAGHEAPKTNVSIPKAHGGDPKTLLPKTDDLHQGELPHKKVQISSNLFHDLVKLSYGASSPSNDSENHDIDHAPQEKLAGNNQDPVDLIPKINVKFEEGADSTSEPESKTEKSHENDFEKALEMVENSNKMLVEFQSTQDAFIQKIQELAKEAKVIDAEESPFERLNRMSRQQKDSVKPNNNPSCASMLSLFTSGRTSFPYTLKLSAKLPSPILREKNVKISVELVRTSDGTVIENHGSMLLQVSLYTWQLPANPILRNRAGNKVLQGEDECELKHGRGSFDKLQINEVTSKFINGYIAILVVPKRPINFGTSLESLQQKKLFKIQDVKPLLVERVIVKSKKKNPRP